MENRGKSAMRPPIYIRFARLLSSLLWFTDSRPGALQSRGIPQTSGVIPAPKMLKRRSCDVHCDYA
jgi:hypothetical protein